MRKTKTKVHMATKAKKPVKKVVSKRKTKTKVHMATKAKKPVKKVVSKKEYSNEMRMVVFPNKKRTKGTDDAMSAKFEIDGEVYNVGLKSKLSEAGKQYYKGLKDSVEVVLFINEDKEDKQPDLRGKVNVNDTEWFVSLWKQETDAGLKYLSGVISPPYEGGKKTNKDELNRGKKRENKNVFSEDWSDDLPF